MNEFIIILSKIFVKLQDKFHFFFPYYPLQAVIAFDCLRNEGLFRNKKNVVQNHFIRIGELFKIRNGLANVVINGKKAYDVTKSISTYTSGAAFGTTSGPNAATEINIQGVLSPGEEESIVKNLKSVAGRLVEKQQTSENFQNIVSLNFL